MFRERFITAVILIPLVLLAICYGNIWALSAVMLALMVGLGYEWMFLIPLKHITHQCLFMILLLLALLPSLFALSVYLQLNCVIWGLIFVALLTYPASQSYWGYRSVVTLLCVFSLPLFLSSLHALLLEDDGRVMLIYLLCLVWSVDIGAYLVGKQWGRHKLIPRVSPGKSWEGALGGCLAALLVAWGGYYYAQPAQVILWFVSALLIVLISMLGDLFISMLKRRCQLKDTGRLLPGHGGLLDRLDSLIAALPFFYYLYPSQFQ